MSSLKVVVNCKVCLHLFIITCDVQELPVFGRTLVVGRRTNMFLGNDSLLYLPEYVTIMARQHGRLFKAYAEDYFFLAHNDFPWDLMANVVVGRPGYDNYLVALAIQQNVTVIDATRTILAVHQTDNDGNWAGYENADSGFNRNRIGSKFSYRKGYTTAAQYVTRFVTDRVCNGTNVIIERRKQHTR